MTKEYILIKEDFKNKIINLPKNLSEKKFNRILKKLEKIGYDNMANFVKYINIKNNQKYISSIYDLDFILHFSHCEECGYLREDEEEGGFTYEHCEKISIKDFLAEPKETFNPHLTIAGIEIPYYPLCPIEEYETYILEFNGVKIEVPNEYKLVRSNTTILSGCCVPSFCNYCGKNIPIQVSKGNNWVCPYCLNGEPKEEKLKTFNSPEDAVKWLYNNPMKEIEFEIESIFGTSTYRERFNSNCGVFELQKYFEYKSENSSWVFDNECLSENFDKIYWKNIREYKGEK